MLRIKKLDIFILKSFCLLFTGTFFICLFIFMMQFLWKYVDEMVGKGLEMSVLGEFFFYSALTLVPVSLPLAVLLAALITFGNFGERFELLAMKAAGISLIQIMRPLIIFMVGVSAVSFLFQDVIAPHAETKLWTLLISMKQKSPELDIPEGVFYDEIEGYNLYVKRKDRKTGMLYDVLIYNLEKGFENAQIIKSDSGRLEMTADKQHLYLHLYDGEQFENLKSQNMSQENVPYRRETFREKHVIIEFDSDFNMVDEGIMSSRWNSKNMGQLMADVDSMQVYNDSLGRAYYDESMRGIYRPVPVMSRADTLKLVKVAAPSVETNTDSLYDASSDAEREVLVAQAIGQAGRLGNVDSLYQAATLADRQKIITNAVKKAEETGNRWSFNGAAVAQTDTNIRRHIMAWHEKLTLSLACLIFFFIGAPLGGIIRKGGLGMPVVVSVVIFIFYYIINNTGFKMARDGNWIAWIGMWTSTAVLAPIGAFLTYKSNNDSVVLNADAYINWLKALVGIRSVRHLFRKEVIIQDPDYDRLPADLRQLTADCQAYAQRHRLNRPPSYVDIWFRMDEDEEIIRLNDRLEELVEEMSNSRSMAVLMALNHYPILSVTAHRRPFSNRWLCLACGIVLPVGLFFWGRIWAFRRRLGRDMETIAKTNADMVILIQREKNEIDNHNLHNPS